MKPLLLAVLAASLPAHGAIVTIVSPAADTFVHSLTPDTNYGAAGAMEIVPAANAKGEFDTLLRFNAAAAVATLDGTFGAGKWVIDGVTLTLGSNFGGQGAVPPETLFPAVSAGRFAIRWLEHDDWVEGTGKPSSPKTNGVTFNTLPSFLSFNDQALGTFSFTAPGNLVTSDYPLALNSAFVGDLAAGGDVSFELVAVDAGTSYLINSRNFSAPDLMPHLSISASAVPEPGAVSLEAAALGIGLARRRRGRA